MGALHKTSEVVDGAPRRPSHGRSLELGPQVHRRPESLSYAGGGASLIRNSVQEGGVIYAIGDVERCTKKPLRMPDKEITSHSSA